MNYPLISEYIEAIKFPEDNFKELSYLRPVLDKDGQPIMSSGNFAVVFKMKNIQNGNFYAIKCFTRDQKERTDRYKLITEELEFTSSCYLISIRYYEHELFVDSSRSEEEELPILLMDWVEGITLDAFIKNNIDDFYSLEVLTYRFCEMGSWLLTQPFAHGDLKPDNILVNEDGQLVLVDYDGMYVPSMKDLFFSNEIGSPGFRHPHRTEGDFYESIDDFSIASIALSLKAFAIESSLYLEFGGNDKLLFSEEDFIKPNESRCISYLQNFLYDPEFCQLYGLFLIALANMELFPSSYKLFKVSRPIKRNKIDIFDTYEECCEAINFIRNADYKKAFDIFNAYADYFDNASHSIIDTISLAQNGLGYMYANGLWVEKNYKQAVKWFKMSMQNGNDEGLFNLGVCYYNGWGVEKDEEKANILFHQAALKKVGPALDLESWMVCLGVSAQEELSMNISKQKEITSTFIL